MIKNLIIGIVLFVLGIYISIQIESFLRSQILDIYPLVTNNNIQFIGKNFHLFASPLYYFGIEISFLFIGLDLYLNNFTKFIRNFFIWQLSFMFLSFSISFIDAQIKIIECTTCVDGIRTLGYGDVNYGATLGISAIISCIPYVWRMTKNRSSLRLKHDQK